MAVTPLIATHRARIAYTVDLIHHNMDLLCSAVPAGTPSGFRMVTYDATAQDADVLVQALAALLAAILPSAGAGNVDTWTLEQYSGGAYIPVYSNGIGIAGSNATARSAAARATAVYRDLHNYHVRNVVIGIALTAPTRGPIAGAGGAFGAYWNDFVNKTTTHAGNWVTGRDGNAFLTALEYTTSLDRKTRRRMGLI